VTNYAKPVASSCVKAIQRRSISGDLIEVATGGPWPVTDHRLAGVARWSLANPKQPVANGWFRDGQFAAARKFLEPLST
jgi:hypothetical protein